MKQKLTTPIPVKKALKKLGKDIREARIRRRIPVALMAERVGISRVTLKSVEDGRPTVSMGIYATALYVLGMLDRLKDIADIAFDFVGQALSSEKLPKRIIIKRNITTIIPVKIGFFGYYFKYIKTIQIFQKFSQGLTSDTWNLKYPQLSEIQLLIPNIEEQEKIYETFKFLDDKILLSENTLNLLQDIKKGLLQKMFI